MKQKLEICNLKDRSEEKMRKETDIQAAICEYLKIKGYFFTRINTTPIFDQKSRRYRALPKYTMPGFPDILILKEGLAISCEVKSEKGVQSANQKEFQKRFELAGGAYFVARSVGDVQEQGL